MNEVIEVENTEMIIREYKGQRVVTFDDIDKVHQRPKGTAKQTFNRNKRHFEKDIDYFIITAESSKVPKTDFRDVSKVSKTYFRNIDVPNRGITVFTESG